MIVNAIWDKAAIPAMSISFEEVRIYADKAVAIKETKFGLASQWWPIAIVGDEYMTRATSAKNWSTQHPIGEGIAAGDCYVIFRLMITEEEITHKSQFFIAIFISQ